MIAGIVNLAMVAPVTSVAFALLVSATKRAEAGRPWWQTMALLTLSVLLVSGADTALEQVGLARLFLDP